MPLALKPIWEPRALDVDAAAAAHHRQQAAMFIQDHARLKVQ